VPAARVYRVTRDGTVTEMITFGDIVPTGLAVRGATIYLAEAGPVPHLPGTGTVVSFGPKRPPRRRWPRAARCWLTYSSAAAARCMPSPRAPGPAAPPGVARAARHRRPGQGHRGRHLHRRHRSSRPADLARVHRHHRLRFHLRRRDLEDQRRRRPPTAPRAKQPGPDADGRLMDWRSQQGRRQVGPRLKTPPQWALSRR